MPEVYRGKIIGFRGSWLSGLATLIVEDFDRGEIAIPCDNGATVRALEDAFGNVIAEGHTVNNEAIQGKEIYYSMDDMGLVLGGFTPVEDATPQIVEAYKNTIEGGE